ncbi:MAG: DNA lyase [Verrucomicrobia bacterium]|nr:DNA lyase [Verrucomicrobiota bacterium]
MRVWTLHPKHLDPKGLVALWREALLAQKVLRGATRGYRHHPQLARFRARRDPVAAIAAYLRAVADEARRRGYGFDEGKIAAGGGRAKIPATRGQLLYEWQHLLRKLRQRDPAKHRELLKAREPAAHPLFRIVPGKIEPWEITKPRKAKQNP